jgi:hypothetical protein
MKAFGLEVVLVATLLAACGAAPGEVSTATSTPAATSVSPTPEPSESDPVVDPTPTETEGGFTTSAFGTTRTFTLGDDEGEFSVRVGAPTKAKCQYSYAGCEKPETGDRVVTSTVLIQNTGSTPIEIGEEYFVLEFADGTRMEPDDGSAIEYSPDNAMDYSQKIRPGGKYNSTLTFEAPKGSFTIIILSNSFDGEDLHGWK